MRNFGDELGPAILERLGHTVRRVPLAEAELVACGSILEIVHNQAPDNITVWGSGFLTAAGRSTRLMDIRAVRGHLTAAALTAHEAPLGDPGLLVSALWERPTPRYRLGVVRHYVDHRTYPHADIVINTTGPVDQVIAQIGSCHTIVSSSLHGLIAAAAYGIPATRIEHPDVVGGDHKWIDYVSALDGTTVADTQQRLLAALNL
jgi:hypothetical protein